jgi:hypothetical protein
MLNTGALPKKLLNFWASKVALVTMSLKSARSMTTWGRRGAAHNRCKNEAEGFLTLPLM